VGEKCFNHYGKLHGVVCAACNKGYVEVNGSCLTRGTCANGVAKDVVQNGRENCNSCKPGYILKKEACLKCPDGQVPMKGDCVQSYRKICMHGEAQPGVVTDKEETEDCASCHHQYVSAPCGHGRRCCSRRRKECEHGTAEGGTVSANDNPTKCTKCDDGYWLDNKTSRENKICQEMLISTCSHGTPSPEKKLPSEVREECTSCDDGYSLDKAANCVQSYRKTCMHGETQPGRVFDVKEAEDCASCHHPYVLAPCWQGRQCCSKRRKECDHGIAEGGTVPADDNPSVCAHCDDGYWLHNKTKTCHKKLDSTCSHGTAVPKKKIPGEEREECASCDDGYLLDRAMCQKMHKTTCIHGVEKKGWKRANEDSEDCDSCDEGYGILWTDEKHICQKQEKASCDHGQERDVWKNPDEQREDCESCDDGYVLNAETKRCFYQKCDHGTPPKWSQAAADMGCATCDDDYWLDENKRCREKISKFCHHGAPPEGLVSLKHDDPNLEECVSCHTNYQYFLRQETKRCEHVFCLHGQVPDSDEDEVDFDNPCVKCDSGYCNKGGKCIYDNAWFGTACR